MDNIAKKAFACSRENQALIYLFITVCSILLVIGLFLFERLRKKKNNIFLQHMSENGFFEIKDNEVKRLLAEISKYSQDYYLPGELINCLKNNEKFYIIKTRCTYVTGQETFITMLVYQLDFSNDICGHIKLPQSKNTKNELDVFVSNFLSNHDNYKKELLDICFCENYLVKISYDSFRKIHLDENINMLLSLETELKKKTQYDCIELLCYFPIDFILLSKDQRIASIVDGQSILDDTMGDLVYTGGLGYFAQLQTINRMLSQQSQSKGMTLIGYGSYGYEPKLKQGVLAIPQAILPGGMGTNMRVIDTSITVNGSSINFTMGMNSSMLESGISEQLFCNEEMNPDNKPCYGISTASGLAMAQQQGQKIYQITAKNKDQLKNVGMSGEEMSKEIYQAINAGGVVILPEKAVDGSGRNAIYVYYVSNPATGFTAWKISGGLNGGTFNISADSFMKLTKGFLSIAAGSVEDAIIFLIKQILSYSSKLMKKILKFFYIFELGKHCFDDPDIGNLGAFFAGFICWFLQYGIAILIGAFIGFSFTGLLGLFVAIIMAVIIAEIIRLLTFGKLEQCQQWALARCKAI